MKRAFLFSSGITAIVAGVLALAYFTSAATTRFSFVGRGIVREHDFAGKNMRVDFTQLSERAKAIGLGASVDVSVGGAKFYKRGANGKLHRINRGNIAVGDEVSLRGTVKSDDRFVATYVTVVDTTFVMKGKLRTYSASSRTMTVDVDTSTYRPATYNKTLVSFIFSAATKFYSDGKEKQLDEVTASDQKVRAEGKRVSNTYFEVTSLYENIP